VTRPTYTRSFAFYIASRTLLDHAELIDAFRLRARMTHVPILNATISMRMDFLVGTRLAYRRGHGGHAIEAVARGLAALRVNEWVVGIAQGPSVVKVSLADVRVEHAVKFTDFMKWPERPPRSPRDVSGRHEIRTTLEMPVSR